MGGKTVCMRQLSPLDARLLDAETPATAGHVGALVLVDPPSYDGTWGLDVVRAVLEPRLHLVPTLRRRLLTAPLGLGRPALVDDPHFDLELHLGEVTVPTPGTAHQLAERVARLHSRPLDRGRPLWELVVITGLEGGGAAVYARTHHVALADAGGADVLDLLLEPDAEPREVGEEPTAFRPPPLPSVLDLAGREIVGLALNPAEALRVAPRVAAHVEELPGVASIPGVRQAAGVAGMALRFVAGVARPGPRDLVVPYTRLSGAVTAHRRFAHGSLSLTDVSRVADHAAATVEEVVLALTATVLRRWLLDRDALPSAPLVAAVPTPPSGDGSRAVALVALPTQVRGAAERLDAVRQAVRDASEHLQPVATAPAPDPSTPAVTGRLGLGADAVLRQAAAGAAGNLVVEHVVGPQQPLHLAGARVHGLHPVGAVTDTTGGLSVGVVSYDGRLHLGLVACREMVPDVERLIVYLGEALEELLDLVRP